MQLLDYSFDLFLVFRYEQIEVQVLEHWSELQLFVELNVLQQMKTTQ